MSFPASSDRSQLLISSLSCTDMSRTEGKRMGEAAHRIHVSCARSAADFLRLLGDLPYMASPLIGTRKERDTSDFYGIQCRASGQQ